MAISEKSFRDRQGKAQFLQDATDGFTLAFAPADSSLNPINFQLTIDGVDAANSNVETLAINYTNSATQRVALVKAVSAAVTQALGYIKSNSAWASNFKAAKMAADKLRGVSTPTTTTPPADPGSGTPPPAEEEKRTKGQRAYVELASHLQGFINAATACVGFAPPSGDITLVKLNEHLSAFKALNGFISSLDGQLTTARELRSRLYFSPAGLQTKFQSVKEAVKGQYGQKSAEYGTVKGIKW